MQDFGRVNVVIDGARQNFQRTGHNADGVFYLDPEMIGGADVVRGPVANIFGSGAIGGVVSFKTKEVDDVLRPGEKWGVETRGEIGSNKMQGAGSVFAAVRVNPKFEFLFGTVERSKQNYKDANGTEIQNTGLQQLERHRQGDDPAGRGTSGQARLHQLRHPIQYRPGPHRLDLFDERHQQ